MKRSNGGHNAGTGGLEAPTSRGVAGAGRLYKPLSPSPAKRLLTVSEAGCYLGRSVLGIRELIWKGQLPSVRCGRRVHLDIHDLNEWVEEHKRREAGPLD